ncbi:DNA-binding transcriptional LysR family regulator [Sphingobium sp. B2D3A]|uniref:LysR family transcriptional regulator n=1 Tax=unclassified Sphingobium TaxID=2611147 RepID=UPI0022240E75|nr:MULTISPECIES: LysR family transcriptional regulator [unclassified Sphingobium]MCW2337193.1 DNA-binding transcriptional LysR family regulator [Sphingobium sp. B2D3A]MCW2381050.1 DNA-binding transcriptional LysR family regulator [Sphingobium sp. B2D3B]MCW2383651.1 DNA-binding transcriptional LysR family regulator [Sphingobium sp. B2D3D]MCW2395342.1 DNA-binding transcriptional LysR family regulator [Sphingobium sp. B8D3B]MCW2398843.1 DNA-binding transcriptional LysR family regulator [Sphingobi
MSAPGTPTLDQLRIFLAVVDSGSFAAAGRRLNRAVSVISYGIANLEAQLGLTLFEREGTRKPELTVAGRALLADARAVAHGVDGLRARVKGLLDGLEAEVDLAVDVMLPAERLGAVLRAFAREYPTVQLRLHVEALGAVLAMVREGRAMIGISGPLAIGADGVECVAAGSVPLVPVAAPDHPLGQMAQIPPGAGRDYTQLVLTDRSRATDGQDYSVLSPKTWRLADLGAKHALLCEGVGWGNMPLPMVESDLVAGTLVRLAMPDHPGGTYRFAGIWRRDTPPGPAAEWLIAQFVEQGRADAALAGMIDL